MKTIVELSQRYNTDKGYNFVNAGKLTNGHNFTELYDVYFAKFRNRSINLLEIGVGQGESLRLWHDAFPLAKNIIGVDYDQKSITDSFPDNVTALYMDQKNQESINDILALNHEYDIIIDDGCHQNDTLIKCFENFFPKLKMGGVYVAEDIYQSYHPQYKNVSGLTFIEFIKNKIDDINFLKDVNHLSNPYNIQSVHFYNEIVFIVKGDIITQ